MQRTRLYDVRNSRLPAVVGVCADNIPAIANYVNTAQRRLLYAREAGDEGWWGTWAEIAFEVSRTEPYITIPREVARLEAITVCDRVVHLRNQMFEYLLYGNGRMSPLRSCRQGWANITEGYSRNNVPTFRDLAPAPQLVRVYVTNPLDADGAHKIFLQGVDSNTNTIITQDIFNNAQGIFLTLEDPFVTAPMQFNRITGVQKDQTFGTVQIFQVDPTTGEEILLLTMEPSETTAWYRRYYFDKLPCSCCPVVGQTTPQPIQVKAIAKLDLIPVQVDTDYLLIPNLEAIIEECASIRYSQVDNAASKQMGLEKHHEAIGLLQGELTHFLGKDIDSAQFRPFGSARLERQRIGLLR